MKLIYLLACLMLFFGANGQQSMTFEEAKRIGIYEQLDSLYRGGLDSDSTKAVFKDSQQYIKHYQGFLNNLGGFLSKKGFKWGKSVRCFNKIYFSKEGKVAYFLYQFTGGQLSPTQEIAFGQLLSEFIQEASFGLSASVPFSQCSPVKYTDP